MSTLQPIWLEWRYDGDTHYIVQDPSINFLSWEEAQDYCDEHNRSLIGKAAQEERARIVAWLRKDEKEFSDCDIAAHLIEQGEHLR